MIGPLAAALAMTPQASDLSNGDFSKGLSGWSLDGSHQMVAGPNGKPAVQITVAKPGANPWDVQLRQALPFSLARDSMVSVRFWARSPAPFKFRTQIQQIGGSWTNLGDAIQTATPDWKAFSLAGSASVDYAANQVQLNFQLAMQAGTIEIADVQMSVDNATSGPKDEELIGPSVPFEGVGEDFLSRTPISGGESVGFNPPADSMPWTVNLRKTSAGAIRAGDTILVEATMRSTKKSKVGVMYELARDPHTKDINENVLVPTEWKKYRFAGKASNYYAPGDSRLVLFLGYAAGDLEVKDVRVRNLGRTALGSLDLTRDFWGGLTPSDSWKQAANARIEKFRKADLSVSIRRNGKPVKGATVKIEQIRHAFRFGSAVTADLLTGTSDDAKRYQALVKANFNAAVFENDMKWGNDSDPAKVKRALDWLDENHVQVRGHNLVWGAQRYLPSDVVNQSSADRWNTIEKRVRTQMDTYKGRVFVWDVVNEPVHERFLWEKDGETTFGRIHRLAREIDPKTKLCLNEYNWTEENQTGPGERNRLMAFARAQVAQGVPIDTIGLQCHIGLPATPPARILELLDEIATLGKPLEITEWDFTCDDDAFHGKFLSDYLLLAFSHPKVESFLMWGFWEKAHWAGPRAALVRSDWSERPAMAAWRDRIYREWWTRQTSKTAADGSVRSRVYKGTQRVTVTFGGITVSRDIDVSSPGTQVKFNL